MKIMYFFVLVAALVGCSNTPSIDQPKPPTQKKVLELEWATKIDTSRSTIGTDYTQYYKDWVLVGGHYNDPATIMAFDGKTGTKAWTYVHQGKVSSDIIRSFIYNNTYVGLTQHGIIMYDLEHRKVLHEIRLRDDGYGWGFNTKPHKGHLYYDISKGGMGFESKSAVVLKINLNSGDYEEVFEVKNDSIGRKAISPPIVYTRDDGHDIMIVNVYPDAQKPPQEDNQNILAYDLTEKKVLWNVVNFTKNYYTNGRYPPIIYNDKVITGGDWSMYAFDIKTGKQVWRRELGEDKKFGIFNKTNHLIHGDRLYVNEDEYNLHCLDPDTGEVIWTNRDAPNCTPNMIYYDKEDVLVYTSWGLGSVVVVDANTGKTLHKEGPYDYSNFNNDVVYDPKTDMFFASTYHHVVGFKVKRVK